VAAGRGNQRISFSYIDLSAPWAQLMPGAGAIPGQASQFIGGVNLVAEKLPRS
jgi:hypothetical protein